VSQKPILPALAEIITKTPLVGRQTFLVTQYGKPFTAAGFGGWFRDRCDEAGLPQCTAHGLRKAGATVAAENGASDRQLMALFDWTSAGQANTYTGAADRKRMASEAARLMDSGPDREPDAGADRKRSAPPKLPHRNSRNGDSDLPPTWQEWRDSNPQPPVLETGALAIELHS